MYQFFALCARGKMNSFYFLAIKKDWEDGAVGINLLKINLNEPNKALTRTQRE
jgi:hypothetical protein